LLIFDLIIDTLEDLYRASRSVIFECKMYRKIFCNPCYFAVHLASSLSVAVLIIQPDLIFFVFYFFKQFDGQMGVRMKKAYGDFCSRHLEALNFYKELLKTDRKFQTFVNVSNYELQCAE
jgi:hypothetical protein